jgi:hypothetical protein
MYFQNIKKIIFPDDINIKNILLVLGLVMFQYQHMFFSVLSKNPFLLLVDILLIEINKLSEPIALYLLIIIAILLIISIFNNKILKYLTCLTIVDFLLSFTFMATKVGFFIGSMWVSYGTIMNVMFNSSQIEKMIYIYNIIPRDFRFLLTYYFDFSETKIGFIYGVGTLAGLGMICIWGSFVFKLKNLSFMFKHYRKS